MEFSIETKNLDSNNKSLVALIRLLCSVELSIATMKWYAGEDNGTHGLPPHESVLALALCIANIGEALTAFEEFVFKETIQYSDNWSDEVKEAWEFLKSEEVIKIKRKSLRLIRDKSAFHIDPEPVVNFFDDVSQENDTLTIWEADEEGKKGHSPLAANIIAQYLIDAEYKGAETAILSCRVFGALRDVVLESLRNELDVKKK